MEIIKKGELSSIGYELHKVISQFEEQFEDHLIAINENTSEILAVYEALSEIDAKLEKITERVERIEHFFQKVGFPIESAEKFYTIESLTKKEKEIFLIIYTLNESVGLITYKDISRRIALPEDIVSLYISGMMQKGVPFIKKYINNKAYLKLDDAFRERQAKENILRIEQKTISNTNLV